MLTNSKRDPVFETTDANGIKAQTTLTQDPTSGPVVEVGNRALTKIDEYVDLTGHRGTHILNRHRSGSGKAGKTEFPSDWSDERILHQVSDIATDPSLSKVYSNHGSHIIGVRDGVKIRVNFYPDNHPNYPGRISTAFPVNEGG